MTCMPWTGFYEGKPLFVSPTWLFVSSCMAFCFTYRYEAQQWTTTMLGWAIPFEESHSGDGFLSSHPGNPHKSHIHKPTLQRESTCTLKTMIASYVADSHNSGINTFQTFILPLILFVWVAICHKYFFPSPYKCSIHTPVTTPLLCQWDSAIHPSALPFFLT